LKEGQYLDLCQGKVGDEGFWKDLPTNFFMVAKYL
jgi:hypothetical protein